jgi:hypothetical protein
MAKHKTDRPVTLSGDEARAGVTGHHVRYVLAFGLAGSLIAFIAIVVYFSYGRLTETLAAIFTVPGTLPERRKSQRNGVKEKPRSRPCFCLGCA